MRLSPREALDKQGRREPQAWTQNNRVAAAGYWPSPFPISRSLLTAGPRARRTHRRLPYPSRNIFPGNKTLDFRKLGRIGPLSPAGPYPNCQSPLRLSGSRRGGRFGPPSRPPFRGSYFFTLSHVSGREGKPRFCLPFPVKADRKGYVGQGPRSRCEPQPCPSPVLGLGRDVTLFL